MSEWIAFGPTTEVTAGKLTAKELSGAKVAVTQINGEYFAFGEMCSHAEISLVGGPVEGFEVECPAHGARFDVRDGSAKCLPATCGIPSYATKVEDDTLYVSL